MHPILFEIPLVHFPIRSFGVMVVMGFILGTMLITRLSTRHALDIEKEGPGYAALPIWLLIGVLVGARALYVVVEVLQGSEVGQGYLDNPFKVFAYWEGGLVMYGGAAGALLFGWRCTRKHKMRIAHTFDIGTVGSFVGLGVGRIGCLMVGDDFGQVVPEAFRHLPFPITLRVPDPLPVESLFGIGNAGELLWATQIWMSVDAFLIAVFGLLILRRRRYAGQVTLWLLFAYSIARGVIENFRGDSVRGLWFDGALSTSQVLSIGLGAVCIVLLFLNRKRTDAPPAPSSAEGS